jgi:hypothetical protein
MNSPNLVGCMGTLLLRKTAKYKIWKAKRQHVRQTCVTFQCSIVKYIETCEL